MTSLSKSDQLKKEQVKKKICKNCGKSRDLKFYSSTQARYCNDCKRSLAFKRKQNSPKKMKEKAWKAFSDYIRLRDSLKTTNSTTHCRCITCGKVVEYKDIQAGHYIGGRGNSILFDERIVSGQCLTKESNVRLFNGKNKSINKIKKGDKIWAFNEKTFEKEFALVEQVHSFIPDRLFEVEMENGDKFFATADHMVVSDKKWVKIEDMLHNCTDYDITEL